MVLIFTPEARHDRSTTQHSTAQHSTAQHSTAQHSTAQHSTARRHQQGFTLVEIGVVLVIIGLLLGAVLKGQELIASARVNNLISTMSGYKAAINAFQDRYRMMPGDSSMAATKVGNGAVNCTQMQYCDNNVIDYTINTNLVNNHLLAAGLYSGPAGVESFNGTQGGAFLTNHGGGPISVGWHGFYWTIGQSRSAHSHVIQTGGRLSSKFLGELDRRLDDGLATTGRIRNLSEPSLISGHCFEYWGNPSTPHGTYFEDNPVTNCGAAELLDGLTSL